MQKAHSFSVHFRENLKLALPVMLSNLGHVLMGVCDNIMVGHVNVVSLAAAGLANIAFNVLLLFGIGVSYAITPLVAEADGENNEKRIVDTLRHGLVINLLNGIFLAGVVYFGKNVLYYIDQPDEVVDTALPYLNIITFSLIPALIYQSFRQFAEGLSNTRIALVVVLGSNVINVGLNYILIYGHLGFPAYGLNGAGWATLVSRTLMAIGIAVYIYHHPGFRRFRGAFVPGQYSGKTFSRLLHLGIPSGIQFIFEVAAFDFSLVMMGWLGTRELAAHQIVINLASLSYMVASGLAAAATIRVGYFLGRRDLPNLKRASFSMLGMGMALMGFFALLFIFGKDLLPMMYVKDNEVMIVAARLLVVAGLFQLSDGAQVICIAALRGLQDVKIPSILIFIAYWLIGLPLGYWFSFKLNYGPEGIWLGLLIGLTVTAVAMFYRFKIQMREHFKNTGDLKN
jgi:multidrug resistance protein, MATE family